jgi:hypothetical protein
MSAQPTTTIAVIVDAELAAKAEPVARRFGYRDVSQALEAMLRELVLTDRMPSVAPARRPDESRRFFGVTGKELDAITEAAFERAARAHHEAGRSTTGLVDGRVERTESASRSR